MTVDEVLAKVKNDNIKTVIFDFDNTICDMLIDWTEWDRQVGELMRSYDPETQLTGGYMRDNRINAFIEKYGNDFREKWRKLSNEYEKENAHKCNARENVLNVIRDIDCDLWIWSSNSEETVKKYLTEMGIVHKFSKFITRDSVDFIKPNPSGFFKAASKDANKQEFLMVGNSNNDRKAAEAAGIAYIDEKDITMS
jgi:beta-phosphoglucomutase-like phosphatase (HAD superfamily)